MITHTHTNRAFFSVVSDGEGAFFSTPFLVGLLFVSTHTNLNLGALPGLTFEG